MMLECLRPTSSRRAIQRAAVGFCAVLSAVGGCGGAAEPDQNAREQTDAQAVSRTADSGPVSLTLTASPGKIDFAADQRVEVALEVLAQTGVTVDVDPYERALREGDRRFEYRVVRSDKGLAEPTADGRLRWTYRYELEFFLPGECELPPASVSFVDMRDAEDGGSPAQARGSLRTEPLTIVVRAPVNETLLQEEELRKIPPLSPIELPQAWSRQTWMAPLILVVLAVVAVLTIRRLRAGREERVVIPEPHEWAQDQIAALIAEDLIRRGLIQEFYYRISDIVRGYVERRFAVSAPEMTTEEFLAVAASDRQFAEPRAAPLYAKRQGLARAMSRTSVTARRHSDFAQAKACGSDNPGGVLGDGWSSSPTSDDVPIALRPSRGVDGTNDGGAPLTTLLQRFLAACDLVKYARHEPTATECDAVLEAAGSFVEHTREDRVGHDGLSG